MWKGIQTVKPGNTLGDIGHAIQTYAESMVILLLEILWSWNWKVFHCAPNILHYGKKGGYGIKRRYDIYYRTNDKYWKKRN